MEIKTEDIQEVSVVRVNGRIDTPAALELEDELNKIISSGRIKIVINFNAVAYISSGGLRVLLATAKELKKKNGNLGLCQLEPHVYNVFKLAGFTTVFNIYDTEEKALKDI